MQLKTVIDEAGGVAAFAERHKFAVSTVRAWYRSTRFPSLRQQGLLAERVGCSINFDELRALRLEKIASEGAGTLATNRLKSNLPINTLDRLKSCFIEMGLPPERLNLHGPKMVARWVISRVSVGEVRTAIDVLAAQGKDTADIEQINEAIGNARRESLRRLEC